MDKSVPTRSSVSMRLECKRADFAAVGVILLGLAVRLYHADYNFDTDEVFSVRLARAPLPDVIHFALADRPHPPLHIILLHAWISAFGSSELATRCLSVLFSGGFLLLAYVVLRRFVSSWVAVGSLLMLAVSPYFAFFGEQVRPYALIAFLSAANLLAYLRLMDEPARRQRLLVWALTCTLLVYTQYLAVVVIGLEIVAAELSLNAGRARVLAFGAGAALLISPWAIAAMSQAALAHADPLTQISWISVPTATDLEWLYVGVFGEAFRVRWLAGILVILAVMYIGQHIRNRSLPPDQLILLLIAGGLPIICYVLSVWGPKPVFAARQLAAAALCFVIVLAVALESVRPRALAAVIIGGLILWSVASLRAALPEIARPPWREIAHAIDARYGSADIYTEEAWISDPLSYYRNSGRVLTVRKLPNEPDPILVMCRAQYCRGPESDLLGSRSTLVTSWSWDSDSGTASDLETLRLYTLATF
jgi:mannosyltransferase